VPTDRTWLVGGVPRVVRSAAFILPYSILQDQQLLGRRVQFPSVSLHLASTPTSFPSDMASRPSAFTAPASPADRLPGQEIVRSVLGPLTTSLDGLKLFVQSILAASPWEYDPWTPRMPWSHEAYSLRDHGGEGGKLCFAIMWDDGVVKPVAPYTRALKETKKALLAAGHGGEWVGWERRSHPEGMDVVHKGTGVERIVRARKHADHVNTVIDWEPFKSAEAGEIIVSADRASLPVIPILPVMWSFDRRDKGSNQRETNRHH
jgi:hypothetical protein